MSETVEALKETSHGRTDRDWRAELSQSGVDDFETGSNWIRDKERTVVQGVRVT